MSEARVRVSLTEGVLEFEGPENFVAGLVEKFGGVIQTALAGEPTVADDAASGDRRKDGVGDAQPGSVGPVTSAPSVAVAPPSPEIALNDIFAATENGVQILRALPGPTKAVRAVNLAKLYLYGMQALKRRDTALFAEIARVCKAHGCYDSRNMAACLKADQTSFVFGGTGKRQTLKLSPPGMEGTAALIARIRAGGKGIASAPQGIAPHALPRARQQRESPAIHQAAVATSRRS